MIIVINFLRLPTLVRIDLAFYYETIPYIEVAPDVFSPIGV